MLIPLGIVSVALITRILGPEGFGYITIFNLVTTFVVMVTTNWTATSLLRFGREEYDQQGKLNHTFWARTIILTPCLLVGIAMVYLWRSFINDYMKMPSWAVWLVIGSALILTARTYLDYILQAIHRMKTYAATQIVFVAVSIVGLILIFVGFFPKTYLTVIIVGLIANTITLVLISLFLIPLRALSPAKTDRRMVREVFSFSYPLWIGNLAAYVVSWIDVIVIKHYFSMPEVGEYQLAYQVFTFVIGLAMTFTLLMAPILTSFMAHQREEVIKRYASRLVPQGVLFWSVAIGIGLPISETLFQLLFGKQFSVSAIYFQYLVLGAAFNGIVSFHSGILTAYKLTKHIVLVSVSTALLNLSGDFLFVPHVGPVGAAVSTAAAIGVHSLLYLLICQKRLEMRLIWQLILVSPVFLSFLTIHITSGQWTYFLAIGASLALGYCLAKTFHLFRSDDLILLDYVQMPALLKKIIVWIYPFLTDEAKKK
jgi:O-antigen/teichoic acid export membrane protein